MFLELFKIMHSTNVGSSGTNCCWSTWLQISNTTQCIALHYILFYPTSTPFNIHSISILFHLIQYHFHLISLLFCSISLSFNIYSIPFQLILLHSIQYPFHFKSKYIQNYTILKLWPRKNINLRLILVNITCYSMYKY